MPAPQRQDELGVGDIVARSVAVLFLEGLTPTDLTGAVPGVAHWRGGSLPKALRAEEVARLLASCDRTTSVGRRDFAILTLLSRLGLRACEAAKLELCDIDWVQVVCSG